jgi:hypothetical protein
MLRLTQLIVLVMAAGPLFAAEMEFKFSETTNGLALKDFRSALYGKGATGNWQVVYDATPSEFKTLFPGVNTTASRAVLGQVSADRTDERYPLLILDREIFDDFSFSTKVKMVGGETEQMAGIIFRAQDETNFYVFRANAKEGNVRFYKVVNGARSEPIGNNIPLTTNTWHELKVECQATQIKCFINGTPVADHFTDSTFTKGKIGFWTKSDSISYFTDAKVVFNKKVIFAQNIIQETMRRFPRLVGIRIYAPNDQQTEISVIAASQEHNLGEVADQAVKDCFVRGLVYHLKEGPNISVFMPLHDRNGDIVAVARITMVSFKGQTGENAAIRATPIMKEMESRVVSLTDLKQ